MRHVIDLRTVEPAELEGLWQRERQLWRERLFWDVSERIDTFRRVLARRGVQGVALRHGPRTIGYAYYVISGGLGVLAGLDIAPGAENAGATLLQAALDALRQHRISRIESPFVSFDQAWLPAAFETAGFQTYWRDFLRLNLTEPLAPLAPTLQAEPWQAIHMPEAAEIMLAAYDGEIDAEMSSLYRTVTGCRMMLDSIMHHHNSGAPVSRASAFIRQGGKGTGFILITEIAPRQGHLAQVAVHPDGQGQGVGQFLLSHSLSQLRALDFDTLSLIVSRCNTRASRLYQKMGFHPVHDFPVFTWEPESPFAPLTKKIDLDKSK